MGDRLVIRGHRVGELRRTAEVLEVHGEDGGPPYLVRWAADGHESLVVPSSDVMVEPRAAASVPPAAADAPSEAPEATDPELRLLRLEEAADAMGWQLERLREELRELVATVRG